MAEEIIVDDHWNKYNQDDVIACLEFLASDASSRNNLRIHNILKRSIGEINALNSSEQKNYQAFDYTDILIAFKLFTKFCLVDDPEVKSSIIHYIEAIDRDVLRNYLS